MENKFREAGFDLSNGIPIEIQEALSKNPEYDIPSLIAEFQHKKHSFDHEDNSIKIVLKDPVFDHNKNTEKHVSLLKKRPHRFVGRRGTGRSSHQ